MKLYVTMNLIKIKRIFMKTSENLKLIANSLPIKVIISNRQKENIYKRILLEKIKDTYHISKYTDKQVFNENIECSKLLNYLENCLECYKQLNAFTSTYEYQLRLSKKGKELFSKSKLKDNITERSSQNIDKNRIIPEGTIIPPLVDMGVFNKDGKVISNMYDKYRQINRFIEIIDDEIKNYKDKNITVVDFGCGKSYLTFILYYYLHFIKKLNVNMIGLDLKEDVIENCNKSAQKYGYSGLHFITKDIKDYIPDGNVDMVISLHACDTATDYALYNAIQWKTKMIFSVPCCQHEVNKQISSDYKIFTKYGITKERLSAILTDNIRCSLLEYSSYKVDLIEFIDIDHTPKNLLIRASLSTIPKNNRMAAIKDCEKAMNDFKFNHTLYSLLLNKK